MAVSNHAYLVSDPDFQGHFKIMAWYGDRAHVVITSNDSDASMDVVWKTYPVGLKVSHAGGSFIVLEKLFIHRTCIVDTSMSGSYEDHQKMEWVLDEDANELKASVPP